MYAINNQNCMRSIKPDELIWFAANSMEWISRSTKESVPFEDTKCNHSNRWWRARHLGPVSEEMLTMHCLKKYFIYETGPVMVNNLSQEDFLSPFLVFLNTAELNIFYPFEIQRFRTECYSITVWKIKLKFSQSLHREWLLRRSCTPATLPNKTWDNFVATNSI